MSIGGVKMKNRLEVLREYIERLICANQPRELCIYAGHMFSVSKFCAILAKKRNLNIEIATTCGMLHDIGYMEVGGSSVNHGLNGSKRARSILGEMNTYSDEEIDIIATAIEHHSYKAETHSEYDELLKDADVLDHCFFNNELPVKKHEIERYNNLLVELSINT